MSHKHIIISGRVQGVGFRRYVFHEAKKMGIKGWVRNLYDGRVEIVAKVAQDIEKPFLAAVKKGPFLSSVDSVDIKGLKSEFGFVDFEIKDDGRVPYDGD